MTNKTYTIVPVNPNGLDDMAEALMNEQMNHGTRAYSKEKCLESHSDFWRLYGVEYNDKTYSIDLRKTLLCSGASKTQNEWVEYSWKAMLGNRFYVSSLPKYHAFFATLFKNRNGECADEIENVRSFVGNAFRRWPATLTRIVYMASGKDKVMHNLGMIDQYEINADVVGRAERIEKASGKQLYISLFGTDDTAEIHAVYKWLAGKNAYLWRIPSKPKATDGRTVRFGIYQGVFVIGCGGGLKGKNIAIGIRDEEM